MPFPTSFGFSDDIIIRVKDKTYFVTVEGVSYRDDVANVWLSDIDTFSIVDENDSFVKEDHDDFYDVLEEVMSYDYEPEWNE